MIFTVNLPNGATHTLHSTAADTDEKLIQQVQEYILAKNDNYIENWITFRGTRKMLMDCANYLLRETQEDGVLTRSKLDIINKRETPISNLVNQSVYDFLYGDTLQNEDGSTYISEIESIDQDIIEDYKYEIHNELESHLLSSELSDRDEKWKDTTTYKLNMLYSTPDKYIEVGDDNVITYDLKKNDKGEWVAEYPKFDGSTINFSKLIIHNSRKGIIPLDSHYTSHWAYVDTNNEFVFMDESYKIHKNCTQYQVGQDNESEMDHILCFYVEETDKYYFYDENIEEITNFVS